jgi:hypothetical protein
LITIGWITSLWPVGEIAKINSIPDFLIPETSAITFAFLGAYFFGLNLIFRRYTRGDLSPKAYSHITVRILSSVIIVWVLEATFSYFYDDPTLKSNIILLVIAFGIGIVPETGMALLKDLLKKRLFGMWFPSLTVKHPISELDGISLYDQARLIEEGVESIETLAHHNLIELMLRSGVPVARLIDLFDQAILYLHSTGEVKSDNNTSKKCKRGIDVFRENGIRTATDLLIVIGEMDDRIKRAKTDDIRTQEISERKSFYKLIDPPGDPVTPPRMKIMVDSITDDEWLEYIKNWRDHSLLENKTFSKPVEMLKYYQ